MQHKDFLGRDRWGGARFGVPCPLPGESQPNGARLLQEVSTHPQKQTLTVDTTVVRMDSGQKCFGGFFQLPWKNWYCLEQTGTFVGFQPAEVGPPLGEWGQTLYILAMRRRWGQERNTRPFQCP